MLHVFLHIFSHACNIWWGSQIGNAIMDYETMARGMFDFFWRRDLISDVVHQGITSSCNFSAAVESEACGSYQAKAYSCIGSIDIYNIYAPQCSSSSLTTPEADGFDPCSNSYVHNYLNDLLVQKALHAKTTNWDRCSIDVKFEWNDSPSTVLPIIQSLMASGLRIWFYSGDVDGGVPITTTKYAIGKLKPLEEITPWYPWHSNGEVGGYAVEYKGLVLVTVRGAGHHVPSDQPARALTMVSCFLEGKLPPQLLLLSGR